MLGALLVLDSLLVVKLYSLFPPVSCFVDGVEGKTSRLCVCHIVEQMCNNYNSHVVCHDRLD